MGDPDRLLSMITDPDGLERDLLGSLKNAGPPLGAEAAAWARLSAQIATLAWSGSASGSGCLGRSASGAPATHPAAGPARTASARQPRRLRGSLARAQRWNWP